MKQSLRLTKLWRSPIAQCTRDILLAVNGEASRPAGGIFTGLRHDLFSRAKRPALAVEQVCRWLCHTAVSPRPLGWGTAKTAYWSQCWVNSVGGSCGSWPQWLHSWSSGSGPGESLRVFRATPDISRHLLPGGLQQDSPDVNDPRYVPCWYRL